MERLYELRKWKNISQKDVADAVCVSRQAYGLYETGKREPDLNTLIRLSKFFNVTIDYLLGASDAPYGEKAIYNIELAPEAEDEKKMLDLYKTVKQKGGAKAALKFIELLEVMIKENKED